MTSLRTLRLRLASCRAARDDRGATLVEYALLVGFFAVVVIGAVESLQDSAADRLDSQASVPAAPIESNGFFGSRIDSPSGGSPGVTTPDTTPVTLSSIALNGGASQQNGSWTATITATATDPNGNPIPGVVLDLLWTGAGNQSGSALVETLPDGTYTVVVSGISNGNRAVTFAVNAAFLEGYEFGALPQAVIERKD
jgi:Flp pilus assembly pilin Flp